MGNGVIQVAANLAIFDGVAISRYGVAYGVKQAAVPMASVLSGIALPVIGLVFGWRWGFVLAAVLALVLVVSVPHFDTSQTEKRGEPSVGRMPPSLLFLAVAGLTGAVAGNGIALFIVPSAVEIGINEAAAGAVLAVLRSSWWQLESG
jgi:prepilin signal peptidase PulO-like enzyme (type II secretory pathway)